MEKFVFHQAFLMTLKTESLEVFPPKLIFEIRLMRIMAGSTLQQVAVFQLDRRRQGGRIAQLAGRGGQGRSIGKRNRVVIGKIGLQVAAPTAWQSDDAAGHRQWCGRPVQQTQSHGPVMAAETEAGSPGRLARLGIEGG